ncbi:MAG: hypothetical protein U0Q55_04490 [Vicinamibacterales bacterium]
MHASAGEPSLAHVHLASGPEFQWVERAVTGAAERLATPRCSAVLSDFADSEGRTLREVLEGRGLTAREHMKTLWFLRGDDQKACRSRATSAFTVPGGRLVFVCPTVFRRPVSVHAEVLLIHEFLHTLGLGENPPTSDAITAQVARRCA